MLVWRYDPLFLVERHGGWLGNNAVDGVIQERKSPLCRQVAFLALAAAKGPWIGRESLGKIQMFNNVVWVWDQRRTYFLLGSAGTG